MNADKDNTADPAKEFGDKLEAWLVGVFGFLCCFGRTAFDAVFKPSKVFRDIRNPRSPRRYTRTYTFFFVSCIIGAIAMEVGPMTGQSGIGVSEDLFGSYTDILGSSLQAMLIRLSPLLAILLLVSVFVQTKDEQNLSHYKVKVICLAASCQFIALGVRALVVICFVIDNDTRFYHGSFWDQSYPLAWLAGIPILYASLSNKFSDNSAGRMANVRIRIVGVILAAVFAFLVSITSEAGDRIAKLVEHSRKEVAEMVNQVSTSRGIVHANFDEKDAEITLLYDLPYNAYPYESSIVINKDITINSLRLSYAEGPPIELEPKNHRVIELEGGQGALRIDKYQSGWMLIQITLNPSDALRLAEMINMAEADGENISYFGQVSIDLQCMRLRSRDSISIRNFSKTSGSVAANSRLPSEFFPQPPTDESTVGLQSVRTDAIRFQGNLRSGY